MTATSLRLAAARGAGTLPARARVLGRGLASIGLGLFASVTPSPLYGTYSALWHFSPLTLTLIYATYAFGVLASLLLAGGVSDDVGRRPVLLAALGALMASTVLFLLADSAAWLFVARGIQGLATGAALSAASAALLDLHPRRDPAGVGLANATAAAGGLGLGVLVSVVARPARRRAAGPALRRAARPLRGRRRRRVLMPEPVRERARFRLTAAAPGRPAASSAGRSCSPRWRCSRPGRSARSSSRSGRSSPASSSTRRNAIVDRAAGSSLLAAAAGGAQFADEQDRAVGRGGVRLAGARRRDGPDRRRRGDRLGRRLPRRLARRRRRLRRRLPRRPARARRVDPARRTARRSCPRSTSSRTPRSPFRPSSRASSVTRIGLAGDLRAVRRDRRRDRARRRRRGAGARGRGGTS